MSKEHAYNALKKTAEKKGVSLEAVLTEIEFVITTGMTNTNPNARIFWHNIPKKSDVPTPTELILYLSVIATL